MDFLEWVMYDVQWHQISIVRFKLYDYLMKHAKTICISEDAGGGVWQQQQTAWRRLVNLCCQVAKFVVSNINKLAMDSLL